MHKIGRPTIAIARFKLLPAMRDVRVDDYASFIQEQVDLLIGPLSVLNLCLSPCVFVTRYGWVWGVATLIHTRPTEHLNITVKRIIRDGNHHADVNHTILRTRQRLSAITELMAMIDRAHGQPTTASDAVLVTQRQLWRFAVHRQEMTCSLHGRKFVVEGVRMNEIILDLHRCGRHCCHRTGRDWKGMLPAL